MHMSQNLLAETELRHSAAIHTDLQLALREQKEEDARTASVFACETTSQEENQNLIIDVVH